MADYFPLISRAVAGLDKNTGENRRVLYDRARSALVAQLRSVVPSLNESDITRERLALEEAIRRVEGDASKRPRTDALEGGENQPSLSDHGLRGFRDNVADAEGLGGATAEARRSAREAYGGVPGEIPRPDDGEATGDLFGGPPASENQAPQGLPAAHPEQGRRAARGAAQPRFEENGNFARPVRSTGRLVKIGLLLLIVAGLAGVAYWQRGAITRTVASFRSAPASKPREAAPPGQPKIADRVGPGSGTSNSANAPAAAVAQKVVLYDEDANNPQGKRYVGSALWRTETVSPGPGLAPELAVRADLEIPERHLRMTWSLRRNSDKALPASHTIEIMFTLPADFDQGGIGNVPGVLMKANEQARGVPLAGLAVKVTNGYFLIGLSAVDVDLQRNIQLMKERDWIDIPIVYTTGKRAILAMEKGTPGTRAFEDAFRAWGE